MPRDRDRKRRHRGESSAGSAIQAAIQTQVWESVNAFRGKMASMSKAGGVQTAAERGNSIQKAVQELVDGILRGVYDNIPQLRQQ
ncbi:MAG: hypothetical protein QHH02_01350 [Syntrophomonadaceae bacterium]|nr:hypothetical protein [Syntrophomonadaceae bacterium]